MIRASCGEMVHECSWRAEATAVAKAGRAHHYSLTFIRAKGKGQSAEEVIFDVTRTSKRTGRETCVYGAGKIAMRSLRNDPTQSSFPICTATVPASNSAVLGWRIIS